MLFYLTDSLIVTKDSPEYKDILNAVGYLALSSNESKHLLLGDFAAIEHFYKEFKGQFIVGPVFNYIYHNYSIQPIPEEITYYVEVVNGIPSSYSYKNKYVAQLSYKHFNKLDKCIATTLLAEDENDACFYEYIFKWYKTINQLRLNHFLYHRHGGGGCTSRELHRLQLEEKLCLTIIDTDKKYPGHPICPDSTADKCIKVYKESAISKLHLLDVHEIENLLPLNYIDKEDVCGGNAMAVNKKSFDFLRSSAELILPYFDYKTGLRVKDIGKIDDSFIQLCINCIPNSERISDNIDDYKSMSPETYLIKGLGKSILAKTLAYVKANGLIEAPQLLDFQRENWKTIAQLLLDWGCARDNESLS